MAVRENRLVTLVISPADYERELALTGRGWVAEVDGELVGFAIGNAIRGNVWALFVDPEHERSGHGRRLHDAMVAWLWSRGLERIWLTTDPGTRAERFYLAAGWRATGRVGNEVRYELERPK
ncbi:MAG: GNAT family N-acetyltransferase [Planctomycetes bacterium]|nr:GNAT family N-acetyltransferase [Planctomycetota bacterium]